MTKQYELIVIGTGVAATTVASKCRAAGWNVAIIDYQPFGGTCVLRGCDPKKVLVGGAEVIDWVRRMQGKGIAAQDIRIDWRELMAFKRSFTDPVPSQTEEGLEKQGIGTFHGRAQFCSPQSIEVEGEVLEGRHFLIAAGARPMSLDITGEEHLITSDRFLELEELPQRIIMVGGGYIAFEFAHIAARAGAQVTMLEQLPRFLGPFDPDLVDWLVEKSREIGIDLHSGTTVEAVEKDTAGFKVRTSSGEGQNTFQADRVVHAAGRVPDLEDLNLEAAGVELDDKRRLKLNGFLQSVSNPAVYAAGDAAAMGPPLTPVATHDGHIVASNLLKGNQRKPDYRGVPSVVFTIPPVASVGLQEEAARKQGLKFRVQHTKTSDWYTARRVGETYSGFKILIEKDSERILGAHLIGPHAEEVINLFALAIRSGLQAKDLKTMTWAYPTAASDIPYML
jgi:glutathione reductase (NADPH)